MLPTVAVLRGGPDAEHDVSLQTGASVLNALAADTCMACKAVDIFIDRNGVWHVRGVAKDPAHALAGVDVVWNALHGRYGEGGEVQKVLERLAVPFTGSGSLASRLSMNKHVAKEMLKQRGVLVPNGVTVVPSPLLDQEILSAFKKFAPPVVVKPADSGSSFGVSLAKTAEQVARAVREAFRFSSRVIIEEYVQGREATVGVIDHFRDSATYALPPVEITLKERGRLFDYGAKYKGECTERCPGNFSEQERNALSALAVQVHTDLGLRDYSRSDFIVSRRGVYFLEANTVPGLTEASLFPLSLGAVSVSLPSFVTHVLSRALTRRD